MDEMRAKLKPFKHYTLRNLSPEIPSFKCSEFVCCIAYL